MWEQVLMMMYIHQDGSCEGHVIMSMSWSSEMWPVRKTCVDLMVMYSSVSMSWSNETQECKNKIKKNHAV